MSGARAIWRRWGLTAALLLSSVAGAQGTPAQEDLTAPPDLSELAYRFQNPLSNVKSLILREGLGFDLGPQNHVRSLTSARVGYPFALGSNWSLVTRAELPFLITGDPIDGGTTYYGFADTPAEALFTRTERFGLSWGAGPAFLLPTATSDKLGSGKWSAGPAAGMVFQARAWTVGALADQVWSFAGGSSRADVSRLRLFPVVSFNLPQAWYVTAAPEITADWKAPAGQRWVVPVGAGFGKVYCLGPIPFDVQLEGFYNVVHPDLGSSWSVRAQIGLVDLR